MHSNRLLLQGLCIQLHAWLENAALHGSWKARRRTHLEMWERWRANASVHANASVDANAIVDASAGADVSVIVGASANPSVRAWPLKPHHLRSQTWAP